MNSSSHNLTVAHILDHPVAQPILPLLPISVQALGRNGTVQETMKDYNVASYYLTQWYDKTDQYNNMESE
jgi:hypothetical protein